MTLEHAEAVRGELDNKLFEAKRALDELDTKRLSIAYAAHTGDDAAKKSLDKMNRDRAAQLAELDTIEAALAEAGRRVDEAEREAEMVAQSERAAKALEIAGRIVARGEKLDAALATVAEEARAFEVDIHELHALGCQNPNSWQLLSHGARCVKTSLMQTPWRREFDHLAPNERSSFADVTANYVATIERWASPHIVKEAAE